MPQQAATIESLPMAFEVVKAMQADGLDWGEGYRPLGRQAIAEILEDRMSAAIDAYLDGLGTDDAPDRRNGFYRRHLLIELGDIELNVPRTRHYSPVEVVRAYARRAPELDRVILAGFVLGLSTRKVGETLLAILGRPVSAQTVSRVAKTLFASRLRQRAKELGISNAEAARRCGLSERRFGHYVRGIREPDLATLVRIARTLETTPDALLGVSENKYKQSRRAVLKDLLSSAIEGLRDRDLEAAVVQLEALSKLRRD
jgi:transcriptional regulator with XRE-family HTH domain